MLNKIWQHAVNDAIILKVNFYFIMIDNERPVKILENNACSKVLETEYLKPKQKRGLLEGPFFK